MLAVEGKSNEICEFTAKLRLDFAARCKPPALMDEDTDELIVQLCTKIGMAMEDASVTALTVRALGRKERATVIGKLEVTAYRIGSLIRAARALHHQVG